MLNPIDRAQLTSQPEILPIATRDEVPFLDSSITSIKKQPIDYKKRILEVLNSVWYFIKVYFLFLCFNAENGDKEKCLKQLNTFIKLYFQAAKKNKDAERGNIVREFGNLSKTVQEDVKQAIEEIYRLAVPNKAADFYKRNVREQLDSPFDVINKGEDEREIQVYGQALLTVREKYAGFKGEDV